MKESYMRERARNTSGNLEARRENSPSRTSGSQKLVTQVSSLGNPTFLPRAIGNAAWQRLQRAKNAPSRPDPLVQRKMEANEDLLTKKSHDQDNGIDSELEGRIRSLETGGRPLPASERAFFEPRLGHDFRPVRIHTGSEAAGLAQAVAARAFTVKNDMVFGAGQYRPQTSSGRRLLAHELTHVVQQSEAARPKQTLNVQRDNGEGEEVTQPEEQRQRFIEAFEENPAAALASIANILEIGAGRFEVYGLIYHNTRTGELQVVRRQAGRIQNIRAELQLLRSRRITNPQTQLRQLRRLLTDLAEMGGAQQAIENFFNNPNTALATLQRVAAELTAGSTGYPAVTDDQLQQIADVLDAFSTSHAFVIPRVERPRPGGTVLLGYFHSHPQTTPPSGLPGISSAGGDIEVAVRQGEGSFMITGTPANPRIFFIAEGRYWDLTNALQSAIDRQSTTIVGYDEALGGAFLEQMFGAHGFVARMRASERPSASLSYGTTIGGYRLRLEGELNPALTSEERLHEGDTETARLIQASTAGGTLEFNFTNQPYVPGTISLEYLSEGLFRARTRITPWPLGAANITLGGGVSVFEGRAGLDTEGYVEFQIRGLPVPGLGGELGGGMRYIMPQGDMVFDAFYQNPWFRVDYTASRAESGEVSHGVLGTVDYRLPTGSLQLQLGYQGQVVGSIGYRLNF